MSELHLNLTAMERKHIETLAELEKICFSQPWSVKSLEEELENDTAHFIVAEADGRVAGYIGVFVVYESAFISNIAVFPEYRRKGVGSALIKMASLTAYSLGTEFISLEVRRSNLPAIALYETFGFEEMGVRKNYYRDPPEDALIMTRTFDGIPL